MEPILIVSGVLGSICAILLLLLLYLVRAVRRKRPAPVHRDRQLPPGIIIHEDIPQFMPGTIPRRVQGPVSSLPPPITAELLDTRNYGPDMSKFFGHRSDGDHYPNAISLEQLNTAGSPAITIKHRTSHKGGYSCPSSPTSPFSRRFRGFSEPTSPEKRSKRSATISSSSEVVGKLEFSYYFDEKNRQLHVNVIQALRLPGDDNLESYVIAILKPDEMNWRRETKFVFNSVDPLFNETFLVSGFTHTKIRECSLQFLVMNNAENKAIGQLHVSLADLQPNKITSKCLSLTPMVSDELGDEFCERPPLGEILVALTHNPSEGKLTITIKSAKGLPGVTKSGKVDPYIKIRVFFCGERIYKKKTTIKHDTKTPVYEESFDFVVTKDKMPQTSVILRLYHHGSRVNVLSKSILIGVVFLGYQFELFGPHPFMLDYGARHWASIIEKPHLTIEEWHPVQAFST
ncbi:synaptotagmin-A-like isoform X2 [Dendronephthya gigantea]|uniref:synaptotagmin-A-like isoform X2 n=1 Tax=Dendronephthya gigantea TaxID=151771 RepID=UPI00106C95CF|nr:synaptotagmin-A-like isoform X2 [Dendronephthya gigantea]